MLTDKFAVFHKACLIPLVVAFFKIPYQRTRIFGTFKAIGYVLFYDTILYLAFAAMFWFPLITI